MNYKSSFTNRATKYIYAINTYPNVLDMEFKTAIDTCQIKSTDNVLNILAGGIPLENYFTTKPLLYKKYEITNTFSDSITMLESINKIPERNSTIDTIITLAGLHHTSYTERPNFYKECWRILKNKTGKLIIGDIIINSKEADWLNLFVDKYNSSGHKAIFFLNQINIYLKQMDLEQTFK